jgi:hypothetical protein
MRADGRRTKKLKVAFHFQFSNPAGWRCDECRKTGLEKKRRCGWAETTSETAPAVVWARGGVAAKVCPKSYISGESLAWLEGFEAWKRLGHGDPWTLPARQVHAMMLLEQEYSVEVKRGEQ